MVQKKADLNGAREGESRYKAVEASKGQALRSFISYKEFVLYPEGYGKPLKDLKGMTG